MIRLNRINDHKVAVECDRINSTIFINEGLKIESSALEQIDSFSETEGIQSMAFSADIHKGPGVPVGTTALIDRVYPAVTGNDIGCGMRLDILKGIGKFKSTEIIKNELRHAFFQGGREIFSKKDEVLQIGSRAEIKGSSTEVEVLYSEASFFGNSYEFTRGVSNVLSEYTSLGERDNFLGTIGGGNHFVEIQVVSEVMDSETAFSCNLQKGDICVMVHSGSLDLGHQVGNIFRDRAKTAWQGKKPRNGFYSLPDNQVEDYITASYNAANFAKANRLMMAKMVAKTLNADRLVHIYDSPHNLIWKMDEGFLHRKGSCPANFKEPVIIPGSMGTKSLLALGQGKTVNNLFSAPHGAGRASNRNKARQDKTNSLEKLEVVTKVDLNNIRRDVAKEISKHLMEEAPNAYKDIELVAKTVFDASIASPVAWLSPLLTIKG